MRQISLKFKSYGTRSIQGISIVDNDNLRRRVFYLLLSCFGALGLSYVLILGNMTFNIIERKALETDARALSNEVLDLELTYLNMSAGVDIVFAESMGFKETKASFATRKSLGSIKFAKNDL